jgi:hypothetical protein
MLGRRRLASLFLSLARGGLVCSSLALGTNGSERSEETQRVGGLASPVTLAFAGVGVSFGPSPAVEPDEPLGGESTPRASRLRRAGRA